MSSLCLLVQRGCQQPGPARPVPSRTAGPQRMENYQASTVSWAPLISPSPGTNYCGIIGSPQRPDPLQAKWAQRVSDQQATRPGGQGSPSQTLECCVEAAQRSHCSSCGQRRPSLSMCGRLDVSLQQQVCQTPVPGTTRS